MTPYPGLPFQVSFPGEPPGTVRRTYQTRFCARYAIPTRTTSRGLKTAFVTPEQVFNISNMRLVDGDLNTRAKIRNAAIRRFGADGFAKTSVRAVASEAGVSPALVIHHFGSKEALREACDDHLVEMVMETKPQLLDEQDLSRGMCESLAGIVSNRPLCVYLGRMLTDGGQAGTHLFDRFVDTTRAMIDEGVNSGQMNPSSDPHALSVILTAQGLMSVVLEGHVARKLGASELTPMVVTRMNLPILEVQTHGLYRDETLLNAARQALQASTNEEKERS